MADEDGSDLPKPSFAERPIQLFGTEEKLLWYFNIVHSFAKHNVMEY